MPFLVASLFVALQNPTLIRLDPSTPIWNYKSTVSIDLDYSNYESPDGQKPAKLKYNKTMDSTVSLNCIKKTEEEITWKWTIKSFKSTGSLPGNNPSDKSLIGLTSTVITDYRGDVISSKPSSTLKQAYLGVELFESPSNLVLPPNEVGTGSTWSISEKSGDNSLKVNYLLKSFEKINAFTVAQIESVAEEISGVRPVGPVKTWIDVASGRMIRASGAVTSKVGGVSVRIVMTVNKV